MWSQGSYGTEEYMTILAVHVQSITINMCKSNLCFGNSLVKILCNLINIQCIAHKFQARLWQSGVQPPIFNRQHI